MFIGISVYIALSTETKSYIRLYPTPSYTTLLVSPTEGTCTVLSGLVIFLITTFKYKDQVVGMHAAEADADEEVVQHGIPFSASLFQPIQPFV